VFELDTKDFDRAINNLVLHSHKSWSEEINKRALNIAFRAAKGTPRASQEKIEADLTKTTVTKNLSKKGRVLKKPKKRYIPSILAYKIVAKRVGLPGLSHTAMGIAAKKFIGGRKSSAGFTAFGWNPAILALGGHGLGSKKASFDKTVAAGGFATKATENTLEAILVNRAPMALKIGSAALQAAIDDEAAEMIDHLEKKLEEDWKKS
jgi:hypothetical protein